VPDMMTRLLWSVPMTIREYVSELERAIEVPNRVAIGFRGIDQAEAIGRFATVDFVSRGPLGWTPGRVRGCLVYAREGLGLDSMVAWVRPDNVPSHRLIRLLGFQPLGVREGGLEMWLWEAKKCHWLHGASWADWELSHWREITSEPER